MLMRENTILLVVAVAGSALLWWPVTIEPNLNLPLWPPLAFIALVTGLVVALSSTVIWLEPIPSSLADGSDSRPALVLQSLSKA